MSVRQQLKETQELFDRMFRKKIIKKYTGRNYSLEYFKTEFNNDLMFTVVIKYVNGEIISSTKKRLPFLDNELEQLRTLCETRYML